MTTTKSKQSFPTFPAHSDVTCFNCAGRSLDKPEVSGYAKGSYKRFCTACRMFTFYDVPKNA